MSDQEEQPGSTNSDSQRNDQNSDQKNNNQVDNDDKPCCRICFESEGALFHPCLCNGSQRYIHQTCLEEWRNSNANNLYRCPTCHCYYRFARVLTARFLQHPITLCLSTLLVIGLSVAFVAFFIRWFCVLFFGMQLSRSAFALSTRLVWWSVLVIGFLTLMATILVEDTNRNHVNIGSFFQDVNWYYIDGPVINFFGYSISLFGFGLFIRAVYNSIEQRIDQLLRSLGNRIVEID